MVGKKGLKKIAMKKQPEANQETAKKQEKNAEKAMNRKNKKPVEKTKKPAKVTSIEKPAAGVNSEQEKKQTAKKREKSTKEKTLQSKAKEFAEKNIYLLAAIACLAIIAISASVILTPENAEVDDFHNNDPVGPILDDSQVKMIVITSDRCPGCEEGSSMEILFVRNDVNYMINTFEESTLDGQALIQATGVKKLPAYIIDEESLSDKMFVKTESGFAPLKEVLHFYVRTGHGTYNEKIFAFPEMNLDGIIRPNLLLQEACGNKNYYSIQYFADPYDPVTILRSKDYANLMQILRSEDINATFIYQYLPTYSNLLQQQYLKQYGGKPETVKSNLQEPAKYLVCTNNIFGPKKFEEMQDAIYKKYCELDINKGDYNITALENCSQSSHYNQFITGEEMVEIRKELGLDGDMGLNACLGEVEESFVSAGQIAKIAGIDRTPTALVNCQYEVPLKRIISAMCQIDKGMIFC